MAIQAEIVNYYFNSNNIHNAGVKQELDKRCEDLMASKFGEKCDFDVEDALEKLEKLEIITKVSHLALDVSYS